MNYDQIFDKVYELFGKMDLEQILGKVEDDCLANGIKFDLDIEDMLKDSYEKIEFSLNNRG
jgi:hypothetical protein